MAKSNLEVEEREIHQFGASASATVDTSSHSLTMAYSAFEQLVPHKKTRVVKPEQQDDFIMVNTVNAADIDSAVSHSNSANIPSAVKTITASNIISAVDAITASNTASASGAANAGKEACR